MKINLNRKWHYVAFRVERQRFAKDENGYPYIANGWFVFGQIDSNAPDEYALNWEYLGEYESEEIAKYAAFDMRALTMEFDGVPYCPVYNNAGYAYEGSY